MAIQPKGIYRSSSATLRFRLKSSNDPSTYWDNIILTLNQYGKTIMKLEKDRMIIQQEGTTQYYNINVDLTVEETMKFSSDAELQMQFQFCKFSENPPPAGAGPDIIWPSQVVTIPIYEVLNKDKVGGVYV